MKRENDIEDVINKSIHWRGVVLHRISIMEMLINIYLAEYFCGKGNKNKLIDMQLLILGERMNIGAKAEIFQFITKKYDSGWLNTYQSIRPKQNKKPVYTLNQDIVYCIEQRNIFAHRVCGTDDLPVSDKREKNSVRFVIMKNELKPIDFSDEKFFELINTIHNVITTIQKRMNLQ